MQRNFAKVPTIMSYTTDNYLGFCVNRDEDEVKKLLEYYTKVTERLNSLHSQKFYVEHDIDSKIEKEFALIKKRI